MNATNLSVGKMYIPHKSFTFIQKLTCLRTCRGCSTYHICKEELTGRRNICKSSKFALRRDIGNFLNAIAQKMH